MAALTDARKSALAKEIKDCFDWQSLFSIMVQWQGEQFPGGTAASGAKHLLKEANELVADSTDTVEWADAMHLIIQGASRTLAGRFPDFFFVVREKLLENVKRDWQEPDVDGVVEHYRGISNEPPKDWENPFS